MCTNMFYRTWWCIPHGSKLVYTSPSPSSKSDPFVLKIAKVWKCMELGGYHVHEWFWMQPTNGFNPGTCLDLPSYMWEIREEQRGALTMFFIVCKGSLTWNTGWKFRNTKQPNGKHGHSFGQCLIVHALKNLGSVERPWDAMRNPKENNRKHITMCDNIVRYRQISSVHMFQYVSSLLSPVCEITANNLSSLDLCNSL